MQDFFDFIAAVRAGNVWTAIRLAIKILNDYQQYLPVDGDPVMMSSAGDVDQLVAQLEAHLAQPVAASAAPSPTAVPWALIIPLVLEILRALRK